MPRAAWCEACGLDPDLFADLAELARSSDGPVPTWFEDWLDAEREAQSLLIWSPLVIPGLLQTAQYARVLLLSEQTDRPTMRSTRWSTSGLSVSWSSTVRNRPTCLWCSMRRCCTG